ncbi:hypothetical protein QHF89_49770, partial [Polyangium sorediatum]
MNLSKTVCTSLLFATVGLAVACGGATPAPETPAEAPATPPPAAEPAPAATPAPATEPSAPAPAADA